MKRSVYNKATKTLDPVCGYKWGWSTINLMSGRTNSCHRVEEDEIPDDFSQFHNTENKLETRTKMLEGNWPGKGCEYCRDIEYSGGISDRIEFNSNDDNLRYIPIEFKTQIHPVNVTPSIIETYFSNLCNLGCIYCSPRYSSVLENEGKKYDDTPWSNTINIHEDNKKDYGNRVQQFWDWFKDNSHHIKRWNILGGEPFFQNEFYESVDYLESKSHPELDLCVFSNLKVKKEKLYSVIERIERLKKNGNLRSFRLVCSIDCWGPQQEYVRHGLSMKSWEENFDMLVREFDEVILELHGTMSCLTIKTIPELLEKRNEWNSLGKNTVFLSHNFCFFPSYYSPFIFGPRFFDEDFDNILKHLKDDNYYDIMQGYQNRINSTRVRDKNLINELKEELSKNDKRRGSDYTKIFPWL